MDETERIKRMFDAMDRIFDDAFYGGVKLPSDNYKGKKNKQTYGGEGFDVFMDDDNIYITIELKGISDKGLKVDVKEEEIIIGGNVENRYYENTFPLPDKVIPKSITKTFKREILDIILKRKKEE